jgi:general secretion pathway protein G
LTIFEVLVTVGVVGILAAISLDIYAGALHKARLARTITDIRTIERVIGTHTYDGAPPASLEDIGCANYLDAWGNPYQYLNFAEALKEGGGSIQSIARKDRFLVPINSTYDLYSLGPDGKSKRPLTAKASRDDIIRAADGAFVGVAAEY